jgi:peptidoglycan/xylan/chitin deacetylase (PgdA/CDA1 family)
MVRLLKDIFYKRDLLLSCALFLFSCSDAFLPVEQRIETPVVVITFDDADQSVYSVGYRLMRETDTSWTATHFFPNNYIGLEGSVTLDQEKEMERGGWESGGHGLGHDNLTAIPPDSAAWRIKASYDFLVQNGLSHESFAWASGMYNDTVKTMASGYFANIRSSHDYYYLDGVDRKELGYFAVKGTFTSDDIIARVEEARRLGAPLVVIGFHVIQPDTAPPLPVYYCKESAFRGFLSYLRSQRLRVMSVRDAMKILCGPCRE